MQLACNNDDLCIAVMPECHRLLEGLVCTISTHCTHSQKHVTYGSVHQERPTQLTQSEHDLKPHLCLCASFTVICVLLIWSLFLYHTLKAIFPVK